MPAIFSSNNEANPLDSIFGVSGLLILFKNYWAIDSANLNFLLGCGNGVVTGISSIFSGLKDLTWSG